MDQRIDPRALTVSELCRLYLAHADTYYRRSDGSATGEVNNIRCSLYWLEYVASDHLPAWGITRLDLQSIRRELLARERSRGYINATIARIRRAYTWAIAEELIDGEHAGNVLLAFERTKPLKLGRSGAAERPKVQAVQPGHVRATLPYLPARVREIVRVTLHTGARIGEVCSLRVCDIRRERDGWWAVPARHKTAHLGMTRTIALDDQAKRIVERALKRIRGESLWTAEREYLWPSKPGRCYNARSIGHAINRAVQRAIDAGKQVEPWHAHQLRHAAATIARGNDASLDEVQALLGHRSRAMTEHYAGVDMPRAARVAATKLGKVLGEVV